MRQSGADLWSILEQVSWRLRSPYLDRLVCLNLENALALNLRNPINTCDHICVLW